MNTTLTLSDPERCAKAVLAALDRRAEAAA